MTKDITFIFKKDTGSLDLCFLKALQDTTPLAVKRDAISSAMSDVFTRLIAKDAPKFKAAILGMGSFLVTFSSGDQPKLKVESGEGDVEIRLNQLTAQTAALFSNSICAVPSTTPPTKEITSVVAVIATPPSKELPPEEQMSTIIALMTAQFSETTIQRSVGSKSEFFGDYLMQRIFGKIDSCHFNLNTHEFTLNFTKKKDILLVNLPEGKSPGQLKALKNLHGSTLSIAKQVKGKFNIDEGKLTFQPGCLTLNWSWSSAELLGIFQDQDNKVIMQIKYLKIPTEGPVPAQDFVDIIECNVAN